MGTKEIDFWYWLVSLLPVKLVYFCFMSVMCYATTGKYSDTLTSKLTGIEAIDRYAKDKKVWKEK